VVNSWPANRNQQVSVALSPSKEKLALSVGPQLKIFAITDDYRATELLQLTCAHAPGLAWAPDGERLAYRDDEGHGLVLDLTGSVTAADVESRTLDLGSASAMAFAPDSERLAMLVPSMPGRMKITLVRPRHGGVWELSLARNKMSNHTEGVSVAWSPNGTRLACTTGTTTVWVLDATTGELVRQFDGHTATVTGLSWVDDERVLSASMDATLQVWTLDDAAPVTVVETIAAAGLVFARDRGIALIWSVTGELLAWSLAETPAQLWYRHPAVRSVAAHFTRLSVSVAHDLLGLIDVATTDLLLVTDWGRTNSAPAQTRTYANAKVLLLGDSGVGKSGLALVLAGEAFRATESTHGREVWRLPASEDPDSDEGNREVLLWDLAGQPGYRIVHQLHLDGAVAALILFDSKSETSPLAGVRHWARAVRRAHPVGGDKVTIFLIAARADRGGINISQQRINEVVRDFALDEYFATSAKERKETAVVRTRLLAAIDWDKIPKITSTELFAEVKDFVVQQKRSETLLTPINELGRLFQTAVPQALELLAAEERLPESGQQGVPLTRLTSVFEGCIARLESAGLVKRLKFGDYVLLRPELLDAYAGDIVNAAREEPDGLGSILESRVKNLDFQRSTRLGPGEGEGLERLLVFTTLEELLRHDLALREPTEDGVQLVFPSAYRRDLPPSETPRGDGVVFRFEGPIDNIYATLIVRLTRSDVFRRVKTWQSAARFAAESGQCTVFLKYEDEGKGELWIGYEHVPELLRRQFERFVHRHLDQRSLPGTVTRERQYSCPHDGSAFTAEQVQQVLRRGREQIRCPVCENRISLRDDYQPPVGADRTTAEMDASADAGRAIAAATAVLQGKEEVAEYDVFLCHNWQDKPAVRELAQKLRERGLRPWLDERELRPGIPWQPALEEIIASIPAAAVIVGSQGVGPWQDQELAAFLRQLIKRHCPVVPVLLPGAFRLELPVFLDGLTWVDLTMTEPDPLDQLEWGITGRQPNR
jgi:GTPase SAR1 family protein/nucleotide-binding universal stress UspA family protein